jgi:uncharacterized protein (DUF58 family)
VKLIRALYLKKRLFIVAGILVAIFLLSFVFGNTIVIVPQILVMIWFGVMLTDLVLLFRIRNGFKATRSMAERLSNGDENPIRLYLENYYPFAADIEIIDEIPFQFQKRDMSVKLKLNAGEQKILQYELRPVKRGEYSFGSLNVYVSSPLGLFSRRFRFSSDAVAPVYPSYIQMRKYELMAISNRLVDSGIKKIRRIGHNMEFELIKEYVAGDDIRTINWKATARKMNLMVNHYQDERSQQVYSLIDMGRVMRMPFKGMSLLDYAINATLVISNIAIKKSDKAGLITFQHKVSRMVAASKQSSQMTRIMDVLYNQKTAYRESDYSALYLHIRKNINQRSLLLLYTNFESIHGLQRQMLYLKKIARQHLLVVVFFENTELKSLLEKPTRDLRQVYHKAIAEKFSYDKKLIVKELANHGIQSLLTTPEALSVNTINKYLELKARGMI